MRYLSDIRTEPNSEHGTDDDVTCTECKRCAHEGIALGVSQEDMAIYCEECFEKQTELQEAGE